MRGAFMSEPESEPKTNFEIGILKGKLTDPMPDLLELMSDIELADWEGGDC